MSDATTISAIFKSTAHGPAWHGPSVMELLDEINAAQALKHPMDECHSVWEIMLHLNAWQEYTLDVIYGRAIMLEEGKDWPAQPTDVDNNEWEKVKRHFEGLGEEIRECIIHFDEFKMHQLVPDRDFNLKVLLHGVVEHNIYHTGQIALLKKLV